MTRGARARAACAAALAGFLLTACGSAAQTAHTAGDKAAQGAQDTGNAVKSGGDKAGDAIGGK